MRPSYRPDIPPPPQPYRTQVLDHLGLVAGMFEELGITEVIDNATQQDPEMRIVTAGHAVKAMVLNGLGFVNQQLYLVPHFFQNKPIARLIAPGIQASHLNDDTLGRALDTLYGYGVTELYSLIAATAAKRLGLAPTRMHLDSTSFHVDGRYNSEKEPEAEVIHITRGYSRDHRPDLNQVMLALIVEHQAGIPLLMQPLSGNSSDVYEFGQVIQAHMAQLQTTYGMTYLVADSALYSADNLQKFAETNLKWITRVPATLREAQQVLAQADPQRMVPLTEGYRYHMLPSSYGGIVQRWMLVYSEHRHVQAQRTVDKQLLKQGQREVAAFQKLSRMTFACAADAQPALATFTQAYRPPTSMPSRCGHPTLLHAWTTTPGRPTGPGRLYHRRRARLLPCYPLASGGPAELFHPRDECTRRDAVVPNGTLSQLQRPESCRAWVRFLKAPQCLASSLYLKKPERIMALLMVMTVCLFVYAALEYRIRTALKAHGPHFATKKENPPRHQPHAGYSMPLSGFMCCLSPNKG